MNIKNEIYEILCEVAKSLGLECDGMAVAFSSRPQMCDYQSNFALTLGKKLGRQPLELAEQIVQKIYELKNSKVEKIAKNAGKFELFAAMPGFINIKIAPQTLAEFCQQTCLDKNLGVEQVKNPRLIFFDYGGANVAKELHVGHLRSPIVGEALKRLHMAMGDRVLADAHLGDYGLQMGLTILQLKEDGFLDKFFDKRKMAEFEKLQKTAEKCQKDIKNCDKSSKECENINNCTTNEAKCTETVEKCGENAENCKKAADIFDEIPLDNVTLDVLNDEYPKASKRKDVDEQFKKQADLCTLYIQQQKEPYYTIYKKIRTLSVAEIKKNYELLNCNFDFYYGESDAADYVDQTVKIFVDKGLARESEGALVVDVAREGEHVPIPKKSDDEPQRYKNPMPPAIIKKRNGGDLYATTDIATILMRNKDFDIDEIVYLTDNRQGQHFQQVFRCCKLAGISPEKQKLTHIAFGTMNGADGKPFKTRSGEVVRLKEVVGLLIDKARGKLIENGIAQDDDLPRKIGVGAMKFGDLSNTVEKDYVFDIDKFLSFDGKTGPYLQYTVARINSVLTKAKNEKNVQISRKNCVFSIQTPDERNIAMAILKLNSAYQVCYDAYSLNALCLAAFELASAFSGFYNNQKILSEPDEAKRIQLLSICFLVKECLEKALWTLGIDSVEKM